MWLTEKTAANTNITAIKKYLCLEIYSAMNWQSAAID
jgi:hypothetical protein